MFKLIPNKGFERNYKTFAPGVYYSISGNEEGEEYEPSETLKCLLASSTSKTISEFIEELRQHFETFPDLRNFMMGTLPIPSHQAEEITQHQCYLSLVDYTPASKFFEALQLTSESKFYRFLEEEYESESSEELHTFIIVSDPVQQLYCVMHLIYGYVDP